MPLSTINNLPNEMIWKQLYCVLIEMCLLVDIIIVEIIIKSHIKWLKL